MNFRDSSQGSGEAKYISKKVMVNGQFVTLYSANGQTWVSSPEEIPALMDRLENARITLNLGEKSPDGEPAKAAKPEPKEAQKEEEKGAPPKVLQSKYRMKGPKPRPILRQDGVVIQGTPIEPISASATTISFSSDVEGDDAPKAVKAASKKVAKHRGTVHKAPVFQKKVAPVATAKANKSKPVVEAKKAALAPKAPKAVAPKAAPQKSQKPAAAARPLPAKGKAVESVKKVAPAKPAKKAAAKPVTKKAAAKKSTKKPKSRKR
jgi:ribonuclease R